MIAQVQKELPDATILVIDDGSRDNTVKVARAAGAEVAVLPFHIGLGAALQTGYRYAQEKGFRYFAHLDSDGQHPPDQLPRILEPTWNDTADLVVGSRFTQEGDLPGPSSGRARFAVSGSTSWAGWSAGSTGSASPTSPAASVPATGAR